MTKSIFRDGMKYLDHYYISFKFDFDNHSKLDIWRESLLSIPEDKFQQVVKAYCKTNQFPPQSPHNILDLYTTMISNELTSNQAWEIVEKNLHRGISGYQTIINGKVVYKNDFYPSIEKYPLIVETCTDMESALRDITSDSKSYVKHDFKKSYEAKLDSNKMMLLGGSSQLKLGG